MMFRKARDAKKVDAEWHRRREDARQTTYSLAEWSDQEITRWDLDTARITGRDVDRNYEVDRPIEVEGAVKNGTDIRELPDR